MSDGFGEDTNPLSTDLVLSMDTFVSGILGRVLNLSLMRDYTRSLHLVLLSMRYTLVWSDLYDLCSIPFLSLSELYVSARPLTRSHACNV